MKINLFFILVVFLSGCAVKKDWTVVSGSRSDGVVRLSYEYGNFQVPQLSEQQANDLASQRCAMWGYTSAEAFGGVIRQCNERSINGRNCVGWLVMKEYQCTTENI